MDVSGFSVYPNIYKYPQILKQEGCTMNWRTFGGAEVQGRRIMK